MINVPVSTAVQVDYEGLEKNMFYLKVWNSESSSFVFIFFSLQSFETQCRCDNRFDVTAKLRDTTKCYGFCLTAVFDWFVYLHTWLYSEGLAGKVRLKPTFNFCFRYCGTTKKKDLTLMFAVFSEWTAFIRWRVFIRLGVFWLSSLATKGLDADHHRKRTKTLPWLFFFFFCTLKIHISFCQRTSAFYDWSHILFILSDLYPFRYLSLFSLV